MSKDTQALIEQRLDELRSRAEKARDKAYAPYSSFQVGAALLTRGGQIFSGCNVENATYGATCCAERTAIGNAVSSGERDFIAIAVSTHAEQPTPPCGICRQVLAEFNMDMAVYSFAADGSSRSFKVSELLPAAFTSDDL